MVLWRLNQYGELSNRTTEYTGGGIVTVKRPAWLHQSARIPKGFVQDFPKEYVDGLIEGPAASLPVPT